MPIYSSEQASDKYLEINSCGFQDLYGLDTGSLRPSGRIDFHLLYIAEGACFVTTDGKTERANAGSAIVYLPGQRQEYQFLKMFPSKSYYLHFTGSACFELLSELGLTHKNVYHAKKSMTVAALFDSLIEEFHLKQPHFERACEGLLISLLTAVSRNVKESASDKFDVKKQMHAICKHIYANCKTPLSVADYAKQCNLSESRFSHLFREIIGVSPKHYILNARIEIAKELLKSTDLSIADVCRQTGFPDQNYFSRVFKKITHLSPSAYRTI